MGLRYIIYQMPELFLLPSSDAAPFYKSGPLNTENAGFDLYVPQETVFLPGEKKLVSMGVSAVLIDGDHMKNYWMVPRSSISKTGLMVLNSVGVIDKSYRGELMAFLWNTTDASVVVAKGQRLVQIVAGDMGDMTSMTVVDCLPTSERGSGGFGSTGA